MFTTYIYNMNKAEKFDESLQDLARFARVISHPARLAILKYLAESKTCVSGDISDFIPLEPDNCFPTPERAEKFRFDSG